MVQVDQHPPVGVGQIEGVVGVRVAQIALVFLLGGLAGDVYDRVVLARAQIDHIWEELSNGMEVKKKNKNPQSIQLTSANTFGSQSDIHMAR